MSGNRCSVGRRPTRNPERQRRAGRMLQPPLDQREWQRVGDHMLNPDEMLEFEDFRADLRARRVERAGEPVAVPSRAFDVLVVLLERAGEDVSKSELMASVWGETFVEENNLNQAISALRRVFGERRGEHRFIVTLPGRGYRFVAPVRRVTELSGLEPASRTDRGSATYMLPAPPSRLRAFARGLSSLPSWSHPVALATFALVFAASAISLLLWTDSAHPSRLFRADARRTVVVMPFRTEGDTGLDHLGDGLADMLVTRLGTSKTVVARRGDGQSVCDAAGVGRQLGADCVIEGTIRRDGERIRASARLVRSSDGATLWAGSFERDASGIFDIEDALSGQTARALYITFDDDARARQARRYTENAEAYDAYLRGRYFWNRRTPDAYSKAIAHFEQAIARDPAFALAYAGVADAEVLIGLGRVEASDRAAAFGRAREAALDAIALDGSLAEAHTSLGAVREVYEKDMTEAEREYRLAIELKPAYATAHQWLGELLEAQGRFDEAALALGEARALDPLSLPVSAALGECLTHLGRYDDAVAVFEQTLELEPEFERARYGLGLALEQKRDYARAIAEFGRIRETDSGNTKAIAALAHAYASAGRRDETLRLSVEFERLARERDRRAADMLRPGDSTGAAPAVEPLDRVILYLGLGREALARHWLAVARARHDGDPLRLATDPRLSALYELPQLSVYRAG